MTKTHMKKSFWYNTELDKLLEKYSVEDANRYMQDRLASLSNLEWTPEDEEVNENV